MSAITLRLAAALCGVLVLATLSTAGYGEPVLAVNGQNIDSSALYEYMVRRHGYRSLLSLLTAEVIRQAAEREGITVTEDEVDAAIEEKRNTFNDSAIETGADFETMLRSRGQTLRMFHESERTLLRVRKMVASEVQVTDEKISDYYNRNPEQFKLREAMKVSYIRLHDPKGDAERMEELRNQASEIRQAVIAGTADFAEAAREYSTDPATKDVGGKLDRWLTRGNTPFLEAAFKLLEDGDISDIVPFPGLGYYLIRRDRYVRDHLLDFDEVKDNLRNLLETQITQQFVAQKQRELLQDADVEWLIDWPEGSFRPPKLGEEMPETTP